MKLEVLEMVEGQCEKVLPLGREFQSFGAQVSQASIRSSDMWDTSPFGGHESRRIYWTLTHVSSRHYLHDKVFEICHKIRYNIAKQCLSCSKLRRMLHADSYSGSAPMYPEPCQEISCHACGHGCETCHFYSQSFFHIVPRIRRELFLCFDHDWDILRLLDTLHHYEQTWSKTTRLTRLDEILPVLLFPNEFKDILFPLMVSMPSDSSRIFCRALRVARREFVYTIFGINKLSAASEKADLTASYAEEKGDINERRRPREDLVANIYYYIICPNEERKTYRNEGR